MILLEGCAKPSGPDDRVSKLNRTTQATAPPTDEEKASSVPLETGRAPGAMPARNGSEQSDLTLSETKPVPEESPSLNFARVVLEEEASRKLDAWEREGVAKAIVYAEVHHGLPVALSLAIIKQESRFDPAARGPAGSIGLMQLQPATALETADRTGLYLSDQKLIRNPEINVRLGLAYLAELRRRFENTEHAVGAYNIGPAKMRRLLARRPFRRGPYLTKVYQHREALEDEYRN